MDASSLTSQVDEARTSATSGRAALIRSAKAGDAAAFESLMSSGLGYTYRIAIAILGSETDARDVVQDSWLSAWRQLTTLVEPSRFDAWMGTIVVNACRTSLRRRRRVREIPIAEGFDTASQQPGPEQVAERQSLERAFDRLSIDQRSILVLHHLEGLPLSTIADVLGIPVGTAKSRLHTARAALERTLEDER